MSRPPPHSDIHSSDIPSAISSTGNGSHDSIGVGVVGGGIRSVDRSRVADSGRHGEDFVDKDRPHLQGDLSLSHALANYLALGLVTIIPWHHNDCDRTKDYR